MVKMSSSYDNEVVSTSNHYPAEVFFADVLFFLKERKGSTQSVFVAYFLPRNEESETLTSPIDWECRSRLIDRNWRMQLQGWAFPHPVIPHFDQYLDSQQEQMHFLQDVIADWMLVHGGDPEDIVTSRMPDSYAWYDMSLVIALLWSLFLF